MPGGGRDLLEREAERILEHEHARLGGRQLGEAVAQLGAQLGRARPRASGVRPGATRDVLVERLVAARAAALRDVAARVEREPVEPRRERGLAAELADLDAELGERVLGGVARVLRVGEDVRGEPRDARLHGGRRAPRGRSGSPSLARRTRIGIAQSVVGELWARAAARHRFGGVSAERVAPGESTGARPCRARARRSGAAEHGPVAGRVARDDDERPHGGCRRARVPGRLRLEPPERAVDAHGHASPPRRPRGGRAGPRA